MSTHTEVPTVAARPSGTGAPSDRRRVSHGACGKSWTQRGERTSHCGGCHETFATLGLFDRHRRAGQCLPAAGVTDRGDMLAQDVEGVWFSPAARARLRGVLGVQRLAGSRPAVGRAAA